MGESQARLRVFLDIDGTILFTRSDEEAANDLDHQLFRHGAHRSNPALMWREVRARIEAIARWH